MGGMRSSQDPYSGGDQIVDQLIGQAFKTVRTLVDHLPEIERIAAALPEDGEFIPNEIATLNIIVDGGRDVIAPGIKSDVTIPFACQIVGWTLLADRAGSVRFDIWKDTFLNFPPMIADTIIDVNPPKLNNAQTSKSDTPSGTNAISSWNLTINADDVLRISVVTCDTIERVTLALKLRRV